MPETFVQELQFGPWAEGVATESGTGLKRRLIQPVSGVTAWTPASLGAALFGWFTADQVSTVNTASSNTWTAYSGAGGPLTQATLANRPTYSGSGATSKLTFDATDELDLAGAPSLSYDMVAVIITNPSSATYRTLFWNAAAKHPLLLQVGTDTLGCFNTSFISSGLTIAPSTAAIVSARIDGSGGLQLGLNGNALTAVLTTFVLGERTLSVVGSASGAGQPVGDIQAIVVTNSLLNLTSGAEMDKVVGSLAWEWGLQGLLPAGHPYKSVAP